MIRLHFATHTEGRHHLRKSAGATAYATNRVYGVERAEAVYVRCGGKDGGVDGMS